MRGGRRLLLLVALAPLAAGCVGLAPRETLLDAAPVSLAPGETWSHPFQLGPEQRGEIAWSVRNDAPESALAACLRSGDSTFWTDPWNDTLVMDILGCRQMGAGADVQNGSFEDAPAGGGLHELLVHCQGPGPCRGRATLSAQTVSEASTVALIVVGVLAFALVLRVAADQMDRGRIRDFVAQRGGRVESISWRPFGHGWLGERGERIYDVRYVDRLGQAREASFKTSLFSGVWTDAMPGD